MGHAQIQKLEHYPWAAEPTTIGMPQGMLTMCCFLTWHTCLPRSWALSLVSLPLASLIFMIFIWSYRKKEHGKSRQRQIQLLQWNKKSSQWLFLRPTLHMGRQRHNILICSAQKGNLFAALAYFSRLLSFSVCACFHNISSLGSQLRPFPHVIPHGAKQIQYNRTISFHFLHLKIRPVFKKSDGK